MEGKRPEVTTVITSSALRTARTSDQLFSARSVAEIGVPLLDSLSERMCGTAQPKAAPPGVWAGNRNDCAALRLKAPDMMPDNDHRNSRKIGKELCRERGCQSVKIS